jgi:hypothetical protein
MSECIGFEKSDPVSDGITAVSIRTLMPTPLTTEPHSYDLTDTAILKYRRHLLVGL